jgi:muramoyltetrapeptide carboxypeptidase
MRLGWMFTADDSGKKKMTPTSRDDVLLPPGLNSGDRVRLVSPASTPSEDGVHQFASILESWGLHVEFGEHVFSEIGYLAGTDEERLADMNEALRDGGVRAIFATRGGRGSYRIADRLDFRAAAANPKFVVGFSDITALHLALFRACRLVGMHGALSSWNATSINRESADRLRSALTTTNPIVVHTDPSESTSSLTTQGQAVGRLIGGNLDTLSICSGRALPSLDGCILVIEAIQMGLGQVDRQLTMLTKAGHLKGIQGIAVGQFTNFDAVVNGWSILDVLRDHFNRLGVPVLGGLPIGHGVNAKTIPIGTHAILDADRGTLQAAAGARSRS